MNHSKFVNAHSTEWRSYASKMTRDYFYWMNDQIKMVCDFTISDIVGMPLDEYIKAAASVINPQNQIHAKFYLLIQDNHAVAMGGLRQLPTGDAEIVRIYTKPENRGQGLGKAMLEKLISDARHSGFFKVKLDTGIFMKQAYSLYASHGFTECQAYEGAEPPNQLLPYWKYLELSLQ
jgi:GNAT superfamily N-acetyltransferase